MSRSKWKGPFVDISLVKKKKKLSIQKVWSRRSMILKKFIGKTFLVHTGKSFKRLYITREKVGYKFGEFCFTRAFKNKTPKKKIKTKKK
jgi:small subunit ribosomal protein S19